MQKSGHATLPAELVTEVLELLDYRDLLNCRAVTQLYRDIVDTCTALQYKIQLAISGMSDNPSSTMPVPQKLSVLREYTQAWHELSPESLARNKQVVPMLDGPAWELAGGVLAQSIGMTKIEFRQFPSQLRGVEAETWTADPPCYVRDFTMDPGQDLLVVVEPLLLEEQEGRLHLLSMRSGQNHPLAREAQISYPHNRRFSTSYEIRISGRFVGLKFMANATATIWEVIIWDWLSGTRIYRDTGPSLTSFVFVGDHYVLIGKHEFTDDRTKDAAIYLVDLTAQSRQWKFGFPAMATPDAVEAFEVLCEPGSSWRPPQAHAVPFYVSQEERLIIVKINLSSFVCVSFAMLSSSLLSIAREACTSNEGIQEIPWREWGYKHCSASLRTQWDSIWPCVVYGTKQVDTRVRNPSFRGTEYDVLIEDFNQLDLRHTLSGPPPEHQSRSDWCVEPITFEPDYRVGLNAFAEPFTTSLMYREVSAPCELKYGDVLMISEDSIVVVKNFTDDSDDPEFHVYSL